jgi:hypothetical protein
MTDSHIAPNQPPNYHSYPTILLIHSFVCQNLKKKDQKRNVMIHKSFLLPGIEPGATGESGYLLKTGDVSRYTIRDP